MKKVVQILSLLFMISCRLVYSVSEICFLHNSTAEGVYIQCGDVKAAENLEQFAEHDEVENIQMGWNTSLPVLDYGLFIQFPNLKALSLADANIETINTRAFYGLDRLQELSLYNNKISNISADMFTQLYILRVLDLGLNEIETIENDTFSSLYPLQTLTLRWNNIETVTKGTFNGLRGLLVLNLAGNRIAELKSDVFEDLFFLESLDLSYNALKEIPPTLFIYQRDLTNLRLASNDIKVLPDKLFQSTTALQFFDVSNNLLTHIQENILNNTEVEIFKFSRNHVSAINVTNLLKYTQYLTEIDLDHNPWHCKSLQNAVDELQKSQVSFKPTVKSEDKHAVEGIACKH